MKRFGNRWVMVNLNNGNDTRAAAISKGEQAMKYTMLKQCCEKCIQISIDI